MPIVLSMEPGMDLNGSVPEHPPGGHCQPPPDAGEGDRAVTRRGCSPRT
ncbi:hypothetical protein [Methanocalculus sp.]|nr:hypothetical protein [Methanocalculus sp.]MDG6250768.1 hypothetical protein [Methanocalculus sp.]